MCETILSTDLETYFLGGRTCSAWGRVRHSDTCRPKRLDLAMPVLCTTPAVYDMHEFAKKDQYDMYPRGVIMILLTHGSRQLESLCLTGDMRDQILDTVIAAVSCFPGLKRVCLASSYLFGLRDWGDLCVWMPMFLVELHIDMVLETSPEQHPTRFRYSLQLFMRLQRLERLSLRCLVKPGSYGSELGGDLRLPCLQYLCISVMDSPPKFSLPDLTLKYVPAACRFLLLPARPEFVSPDVFRRISCSQSQAVAVRRVAFGRVYSALM